MDNSNSHALVLPNLEFGNIINHTLGKVPHLLSDDHSTEVRIYQTRIPKYREEFFKSLIRLGEIDNVKYTIYTTRNRQKRFRLESTLEKNVVEKRIIAVSFKGREIHVHLRANLKCKPELVIFEYGLKNAIVYWLLLVRKSNLFAFWGHGETITRSSSQFERWLKSILLTRCDFFFAYTQSCSERLEKNGFSVSKIKIVNNSIDTTAIRRGIVSFEQYAEHELKNKYAINQSDVILIYIGSMEKDKRVDFLLDSFDLINSVRPQTKLFIFTQDELQIDSTLAKRRNVYFSGVADTKTKIEFGILGTAILNPGRVGLIAVDSFAMGVPIVTTNWAFHAPEFSYLNASNSLISEDSLTKYVDACVKLIDEREFRQTLVNGCLKSSNLYTVENMAQNFHQGVLRSLVG